VQRFVGYRPGAAVERLTTELVVGLSEAVLTCGTQVVSRWGVRSRPGRAVLATQPFLAGTQTYELNFHDEKARPLTERESATFQALVVALRRELEEFPPFSDSPEGSAWVVDHLGAALDYVTDSFVLVLKDWTIKHVNTQFERSLNCHRADILGRELWEAIPGFAGTIFETECRAAMAGTVPRSFEEFNQPLGRWLASRAFPCPQGLAVLTTDVTEHRADLAARASLEQKLLQAQRLESLGTLASGIAHDFNNILGVILGNVGLLREHVSSQSLECVDQIRIAGERARELVQQILTYSRATGREFARQALRPLIEDSLRLLRSTLPASVQLRHQLTDEPLAATVNPSEVQQVIMNLCTNAWHAMGAEGGSIEVGLSAQVVESAKSANIGQLTPGRYAQVVVSDTGTGIGEGNLARLFEPFFTTKPRGQGTGLGLYMLSGIVLAHGGAVFVDSELGQGTRFEVWLPATSSTEASDADPATSSAPDANGERVAYVDDDEVVQLLVQRILERAGFKVTTYSDPKDLLVAMQHPTTCFDLLVTDFSMPGMNGLQLARVVRSVCPSIPIIIATGFVPEELHLAVEDLGRAEILNKERTFEELREKATRALGILPS